MAGAKPGPKTVIFMLVWLAVVCVAAILAIARKDEYGIVSYFSVCLAVAMLALFVTGYMPRRLQRNVFRELIGKLFVGLLILLAILILATSLFLGYKNFGLLGSAVLLLFLFTFLRIFSSCVKDFNKHLGMESGKAVGRSESRPDAEDTDN